MRAVVATTGAVAFTVGAVLTVPVAAADPCPQVEVIFARGRTEPAGTGAIGGAFIDALRARTSRSVGYYAVDYPADTEVIEGATDMSRHIQSIAANCPNTRLVLGGYSLGAAVTDLVLGAPSPILGYKNPLPIGMTDRVAAVALFGNGTRKVLGPVSAVSPLWGAKTVDLCTPEDPICNDNMDPNTWLGAWPSHMADAYIGGGLVDQAADFVAARL
jgi:cutinase